MTLTLTRNAYTDQGTFGVLTVEDRATLLTVERPWRENLASISCIPEGRYPMRPRRFNRGNYDTYEVCEVPVRSLILFHRANRAAELAGCIGVGRELGCIAGQWAVLNSGDAFEAFMEAMGGVQEATLVIRPYRVSSHS